MATERRRALHQRSNSQINAGVKQTEDVSSSLASSQTLFHNLPAKRSQHSRTGSLETGLNLHTRYNDENEGVPSRGTSVTSKRTSKTDRSSSPEKRGSKLTIHVVGSTSRTDNVKGSDIRVPSGPPPYTGPPQDTSTIRFVRRSNSTATAAKVTSKPSASTLSSNNSESADHDLSSFFALPTSEHTPSPDYTAGSTIKQIKAQTSRSTLSTEPKTSFEITNFIVQNFPPPPPIPETPRGLRSTIRLVPHSPLAGTPVSGRSRSRSNPRSVSSGTRSRSSTTNSAGSRPRSRSNEFQRLRRGSFTQVTRVSSKHSTNSYISSVSAIGLPPTRPLPTPPQRSGGPVFQEVSEPLPSPVSLPKLLRPILKKGKTSPEIEAASPDVTPPIDAEQFPEIQPALSWILETETTAPAPLKINKPKRARMQVAQDGEVSRAIHSSNGRKASNPLSRLVWGYSSSTTSLSEAGNSYSTSGPAVNVKNTRGFSPQILQTEGLQSQRATVFSPADSRSELKRQSSKASFYNPQAVPEWARVYYGRGTPLPHHREESVDDDDLAITPVLQRPRPARLQHVATHASNAGSLWMGTINPEGRDLQDQFHQPHLETYPTNRSERFNIHLVLACVGFVFPIAWFIGAFHPLPEQKRRERRERQEIRRVVQGAVIPPSRSSHVRGPSITHYEDSVDTESLPSFTTYEEGRRWDNARWWRNVNRVMSVFGILILGAIIALLVVGLKGRKI
ncbi:hypothetical protein TWF730_005715 [Orbilia blumenaviensis]|uniref:Serine-rich protein n=1 Tax=Orbilia blumenaviensis TaxID=1796055 RepID=A0AAV9VM06_9PEZI